MEWQMDLEPETEVETVMMAIESRVVLLVGTETLAGTVEMGG